MCFLINFFYVLWLEIQTTIHHFFLACKSYLRILPEINLYFRGNPQFFQKRFRSPGDSRPVGDQSVAALAQSISHPSRKSINGLSLFQSIPCCNQRTASYPSLDHQDQIRQTADNPVPSWKILSVGRSPVGKLGQDSPSSFFYLPVKLLMFRGIADVSTASHYSKRFSS